ncbi:uncharacterized protein BJ212DRAFT_867332 [Suillus subaureus]|uniref:Secreted protein n=1 Tax=Suillus subaureus TaxID=48587 RepID=A0A9P7DXK3_9AGAM|nr:uncharacterized protein BJ212DRAFT_867332 [Suillus subaureus]KAG1805450.1 hypothetical protein BJ212DRAFT_867332 [Suillus subaureus]
MLAGLLMLWSTSFRNVIWTLMDLQCHSLTGHNNFFLDLTVAPASARGLHAVFSCSTSISISGVMNEHLLPPRIERMFSCAQ